jgi:hypothetical protein
MVDKMIAKGSWAQRFLIYSLSVVLAVLVYWMVGFFLQDLAAIPGPQLEQYTTSIQQSGMKVEADRLDNEINNLQKETNAVTQQQSLLKNSLSNTQNTINQILEIQRLHAQKGQAVSDDIAKAFQQNTQLFLSQQNSLQQINAALTELNLQLLPLQSHRQAIGEKINAALTQAHLLYSSDLEKHRLNIGLIQIGVLILLLLIVVLFLLNRASSYYRPIWVAISLSVLIKIFFVIHDYFPSRYFKYILTFSLIMVVFSALRDLLKRRAFPAKSYLLKQFRDAYEHFLCPMCEYPIRRGPMRYAFWTRRSIKKLPLIRDHSEDKSAYNCPHCGTALYQPCGGCENIRHSLLPFCEHCGTENNAVA